ncbi:unnamed protein product [Adineta ricciae]|uniref:Uncharacterized protein n=1 Tax=Adineta ricciae TaxID=249248 RepID=A0A815ALS3_ADIRI|nr:unnamed protein product [Adineta ricciae]CAF1257737.1 unnamed protein product [Adineta ricciae]
MFQNDMLRIHPKLEYFLMNRTRCVLEKPFTDIFTNSSNQSLSYNNKTLETTVQCVGPVYNQSCLYQNLYYINSVFTMLLVKGRSLPTHSVRTNAFYLWPLVPNKREFNTYADLESFVLRIISPKRFPHVTLYFSQSWHHNIGHALFDGLYPAYVAMVRFPPRHLHPFRILAGIDDCNDCWSEDIYSRFAGLGILKQRVLNKLSQDQWFVFDEMVMGSGAMCQRCTRPNLQLPGGVELDASRLFRDRMYRQHGFVPLIRRHKSSSEYRTPNDILQAYVIDNKRFTPNDRKEMTDAMNEINNYTYSNMNQTRRNSSALKWPLINVTYIYYHMIKAQNMSALVVNTTAADSRSPTYEILDNNFIAQLKILRQMDIHITGPGTGQMYQTFLSDGSVTINIGGIRPWASEGTPRAYTSFLEQHMTGGTPYIKGLYYPINKRQSGMKKEDLVQLIRQAGEQIIQGFQLPVNPRENLAPDGQLFVEMCEKDPAFCDSVTTRLPDRKFMCLEFWVEDFVHEYNQWKEGGFVDNGHNISCSFNRTLLRELRKKYGIIHSLYDLPKVPPSP